jgi:hypothetical protein
VVAVRCRRRRLQAEDLLQTLIADVSAGITRLYNGDSRGGRGEPAGIYLATLVLASVSAALLIGPVGTTAPSSGSGCGPSW